MLDISNMVVPGDGPASGSDESPCYLCGRKVGKNPKYIHLLAGYKVVTVAEFEAANGAFDAGDLGGQPIGSTCLKNWPELRTYATR